MKILLEQRKITFWTKLGLIIKQMKLMLEKN